MPFLLVFALLLQATPAASAEPSPAPSPSVAPVALGVSPTAVNVVPGQSQVLSVTAASAINATLDAAVATIAVDQNARSITVTGVRVGSATLTITDAAGATIRVPIRVAFYAASVPQSLTLRVTGNSIDEAWLTRRLQLQLMRAIALQPGVSAQNVRLGSFTLPAAFAPGDQAAVPVPLTVSGAPQYFDVSTTMNVTLQNVPAEPFAPGLLHYDDDPEKIVAVGVLYRATIDGRTPARLYYYHQNMSDRRRLLVVITSGASQPSSVQLIDSSAGPNIDVMSVGHAVSRDFLVQKPRNQGIVLDVNPGAATIADDFPSMQPLDGAAGSLDIRVLTGSSITVTVLAVPVDASAQDVQSMLAAPPLPGDGHHRTGVFDIRDFGREQLDYTVGGADAYVEYGAATPPATDASQNWRDYGEYGVLRTLTFRVTNPTSNTVTLYFYERPLGGVVRSSFTIDGRLAEVGCARVANRYQVGAPMDVAPGNRTIVVQTMTDGGSNYPLEFGLTATPPQPTTPPVTAPDGCFPKAQPSAVPSATPSPAPEPTGE